MDQPINCSSNYGFTRHSILVKVTTKFKSEFQCLLRFFHRNLEKAFDQSGEELNLASSYQLLKGVEFLSGQGLFYYFSGFLVLGLIISDMKLRIEGAKQFRNFLGTRKCFIGLIIFFLFELEEVVLVDFRFLGRVKFFFSFFKVMSLKF